MSDNSYLKLWRSTLDNPVIFKDADYLAVWVYILLSARAFPKDIDFGGKRITINAGQFTTGRIEIAKCLKISESKIQRILKRFESEQQIEQRTDRQCRLITVLNWESYQESEQGNEQRVNNDRTTSEQRVNTNRERYKDKKEKKGKKNKQKKELNKEFILQLGGGVLSSDLFVKTMLEFIEHRKQINKPMTELALTKLINKLGGFGENVAIQALNASMENGWQGVFPEKVNKSYPQKETVAEYNDRLRKERENGEYDISDDVLDLLNGTSQKQEDIIILTEEDYK